MVRNTRFELNAFEAGVVLGDNSESQVLVEGNLFSPRGAYTTAVVMFPGNRGTGISGSSLWFGSNVFSPGVDTGLLAVPGTFSDMKCEAVNNELHGVAMPYVLNGNPCKVVAEK